MFLLHVQNVSAINGDGIYLLVLLLEKVARIRLPEPDARYCLWTLYGCVRL